MSEFKIEELVKQKKQMAKRILNRRFMVKKDRIGQKVNEGDVATFRNSILSGSTSPYLRAVILLGETNTHYVLSIYEPNEEPLIRREIAAALMYRQNELLQLKEYQVTYEVKMNQIRKYIEEDIELFHLNNIALVNVHHDYVRYFGESSSVEEVMSFHLLQNGTGALEEVIRRM